MRITNLQIKDKEYKNLDVDLKDNSSGVMAFIGNNGSGKSNLLESLSIIFYYFLNKKEKEIPFNFSITYKNSGSKDEVIITKNKTSVITYLGGKKISDPYDHLPKQIVAIYSGEEDRLWQKWYRPLYLDYISNITSARASGIGVYNEMPKMLYVNKFYWHISLLCLLLQKLENPADSFCYDILNIKEVHSVKFKFNKDNYKNYPDSNVKSFVQLIDDKEEYTIQEFYNLIELIYSISEIYKFLYIAFTPDKKKIIEDIVIKYNDENLEIEDFSEGEKKMLLIKAALEFAGAEDSLFILDEPDAHIHLNNKIQIKKVFESYSDNRQVILTTHSPTLTDCLDENSLFMLSQGKLVPQKKQEILENVSGDFFNKMQQSSYLSSKKPIILLVEGMEDKIHLMNAYDKLKLDYPKDLEFDIFNMGGADNIEHFVKGLYSSELKGNKLHISVLDSDEKGTEVSKNLNKELKSNINYKVLMYPKKEVNPHHEGAFTVENMYNPKLYEEAYKEIMKDFSFEYKSIDKISTNIQTKAKGRLAGLSNSFSKEDFNNFRIIFDKINDHFIEHKKSNLVVKTEKIVKEVEAISMEQMPNSNEIKPTDDEIKKSFTEVYTKGKGVEAKGEFYPPNTLIVKAGSTIVQKTTPTFTGKEIRNKLIRKYIDKNKNGDWVLKENVEFSTPSGAINFVMGSNLNGWNYWQVKENDQSLQSLRQKK
jgi:predicted ATP-dependent endonuclease of OLD family